jgi:SAM-dependent methyltransferase
MKKIAECRACGSKALTFAFSVPQTVWRQGVLGGRSTVEREFVFCDPTRDANACGLLQASDPAPHVRDDCASARWPSNRSHLRAVATEALELMSGRDCAALDIGCNDGTLLSYYPRWVDRYGVDPSERVEEIGAWAWTARCAFPSAELDRALGGKTFDIVTAQSVFESIDEPRAFLARIKSLLAPDGVFVLETLYAPMALTRTNVETFASGVSCAHSLETLERLVRDSGLKIVRGALTDKDGGSVRLFVTHAECGDHDFDPWYERLARLWDEENALSLRTSHPYRAFERRAEMARASFRALLADLAEKGERAHLVGAGPDSGALIALAAAEARLVAAVIGDGRPEAGAQAFGLPLITESDSRAAEPDLLLAPASLKRDMLERWREQILLGARIVFATPEPHIVHAQNYASELGKVLAGAATGGSVESLRAVLGAAGGPRLVAERERASG